MSHNEQQIIFQNNNSEISTNTPKIRLLIDIVRIIYSAYKKICLENILYFLFFSSLAIHVSGSKIYWSDSKTKTINRCSLNGSNIEKILEWMGVVEGNFKNIFIEYIYFK